MNMMVFSIVGAVAFVVVGPFLGMLIAGVDRRITARMQRRVGPPILQPLYDVAKLLRKERVAVNGVIDFYVMIALITAVIAGVIFFSGGNLLLSVFMLTLSSLFVVIAAYSARSPYSDVGAQRENLQVMAYEPLMLLMPMAVYLACGSPDVAALSFGELPLIANIPLVFLAFLFILTIKLHKSPFDLAQSHHMHQEIVRGVTTEMSGRTLAMIEIMDWYETVLLLGMVGMFFVNSAWWSWIIAIVVAALAFILEILIDNNSARVKWKTLLTASWLVTFVLVGINLAFLQFAAVL